MAARKSELREALIRHELERLLRLLKDSDPEAYEDLVWDSLDQEDQEPEYDPWSDYLDNPLPWERTH